MMRKNDKNDIFLQNVFKAKIIILHNLFIMKGKSYYIATNLIQILFKSSNLNLTFSFMKT